MVAAAAEHDALQKIIPLLFLRLGKAAHGFLYLIEQSFVYDCRVVVRDDVPLRPVLKSAVVSADLKNRPLPYDVGAGIPFIRQIPHDSGIAPDAMSTGNIMSFLTPCNLVFSRGGNPPLVQLPGNAGSVLPIGGKLEDQQNHGGGFGIRLHSAIGTLAVPIGTNRTLIFATLHLGIFGTLGFDGHIPAVILTDIICGTAYLANKVCDLPSSMLINPPNKKKRPAFV